MMAILSVTTVSILILLSCALFITLKPQRGFSSDTLLRRLLEMPSSPALAARREPQHLTVTGAYIAPHYDPFVDKAIREAHKCGVVDVNTGFFRRVKTMIFVDPMFVDLFLNWLLFYRKVCGEDSSSQLEIVCMGEFSRHATILSYYGIECSKDSFSDAHLHEKKQSKLSTIWFHRLKIIQRYLNEGMDVLLTDSDAVWFGNPFYDLEHFSRTSDIIAQKGFAPWDLALKWGSCLCFGFIYVKSSPFTIDLFRNIDVSLTAKIEEAEITNEDFKVDDQHAINRQLDGWNISWPQGMIIAGNSSSEGVVVRNDSEYRVTLLPHSHYVRYCLPPGTNWVKNSREQHETVNSTISGAIIAHCQIASGNHENKEIFMRLHGMWTHKYSTYVGVIPSLLNRAKSDDLFSATIHNDEERYGTLFDEIISEYGSLTKKITTTRLDVAILSDEKQKIVRNQAILAAGGNASALEDIEWSSGDTEGPQSQQKKGAATLAELRESLARMRANHAALKAEWEKKHPKAGNSSSTHQGPRLRGSSGSATNISWWQEQLKKKKSSRS